MRSLRSSRLILALAGTAAFAGMNAHPLQPAKAQESQSPSISNPNGAFAISPLRVEMPHGATHSQIRLTNSFQRRTGVQVRVFEWSQIDGRDVYELSGFMQVSPSIIQMEPNAEQVFHIIQDTPLPSGEEHTFRIVIDQLPNAQENLPGMANTRLQMTIPLFIARESADDADVSIKIVDGELNVANQGGRTIRISKITAEWEDDTQSQVGLISGRYVLGGSTKRYQLPSEAACSAGVVPAIRIVIDQDEQIVPAAQLCS